MMVKEYFGAKFLLTKYSALDGFTTVCFEEQSGEAEPFRILVNQREMRFEGRLKKTITNMDELQDWAKLVSVAWSEHQCLAPKLTQTFSGH